VHFTAPDGTDAHDPIALREQEQEPEGPPDAANEEHSHNAPDPHHAETQSEVQNRGERDDQRTVAARPESSDNHAGQSVHDTAQPEGSRGEFRCPGGNPNFIDLSQVWEEVGKGVLRSYSMLPRRPPKHLVPSRLPWKLPPQSTINTRFVRNPLLWGSFRRINLQETAAVRDKIEALHSRIVVLEKFFEKPSGDKAETRRREELSTYVTDSLSKPDAQSHLVRLKLSRKFWGRWTISPRFNALSIMFKTAKKFLGFLKIYERLSTTTRSVRDLDTLLVDVDKGNSWCNKMKFTSKDVY